MSAKLIESLDELKSIASENPIECFIKLKHGAKSSKSIQYFPNGMPPDERNDIESYQWDIFSSIADTYIEIQGDEELKNQTHLID